MSAGICTRELSVSSVRTLGWIVSALFVASTFALPSQVRAQALLSWDFEIVAKTGDPAPGGGTFAAFITPDFNNAGDFSVAAQLDSGAIGVYLFPNGGTPRAVATVNTPIPGLTLTPISMGAASLNEAGDTAFFAFDASFSNAAVIQEIGGVLSVVAQVGDAAPGTAETILAAGFSSGPVLNNIGTVTLPAFLDDAESSSGFFQYRVIGLPRPVAITGDPAPLPVLMSGAPPIIETPAFNSVGTLAMSDSNELSLELGALDSINGARSGIYRESVGVLTPVAVEGGVAPLHIDQGRAVNETYLTLGLGKNGINSEGDIAFRASTVEGSEIIVVDRAVGPMVPAYTGSGDRDATPVVPTDGMTLTSQVADGFGRPAINDLGDVAFTARGMGSFTSRRGIFLFDSVSGSVFTVVEEDQTISGGTGTFEGLTTDPVINNSRELAIQVTGSTGDQFLLIARPRVIETIAVGMPGRSPDPKDCQNQTPCDQVDSVIDLGRYETTNSQYTQFLIANDFFGQSQGTAIGDLYHPNMGTEPHGGIDPAAGFTPYSVRSGFSDKPVTWISWRDAARFVNWLNSREGPRVDFTNGPEHNVLSPNVAYDTTVANPEATATRSATAQWFLPSESEWHKAAYLNPKGLPDYYLYPHRSNIAPTAEMPPGRANSANYNNGVGTITDVGSYAMSIGPFGHSNLAGNAIEWTDTINPASRVLRGSGFSLSSSFARSDTGSFLSGRLLELADTGFRVARRSPVEFTLLPSGNVEFTNSGNVDTGATPEIYPIRMRDLPSRPRLHMSLEPGSDPGLVVGISGCNGYHDLILNGDCGDFADTGTSVTTSSFQHCLKSAAMRTPMTCFVEVSGAPTGGGNYNLRIEGEATVFNSPSNCPNPGETLEDCAVNSGEFAHIWGQADGFVSEGTNFRWLDDGSHRGLFPQVGTCTVDFAGDLQLINEDPFANEWDCCTWQVDMVDGSPSDVEQIVTILGSPPGQPDNGDGDIYLDKCDNCQFATNEDQADADGDLVGDLCDNCPTVSNFDQTDTDMNGVGDACQAEDGDGDGEGDFFDNCPFISNDQSDSGGLGAPVADGIGDACQCGDADDTGTADMTDVGEIRAALADNGMNIPGEDKCNVAGPVQAGDGPDANSLRDDCSIVDVAVMRRLLDAPSLGAGQVCDPAVP